MSPTSLTCPTLPDGITYDKPAISDWLRTHDLSPITRQTLANKFLTPNYRLRATIQMAVANLPGGGAIPSPTSSPRLGGNKAQ